MIDNNEFAMLVRVFSESDMDFERFYKARKVNKGIKRVCFVLKEMGYSYTIISRFLDINANTIRDVLDKEKDKDREEAQSIYESLLTVEEFDTPIVLTKEENNVVRTVLEAIGVTDYEFKNTRVKKAIEARQLIYSIFRRSGYSAEKIAKLMGCHYTTVNHSLKELSKNKKLINLRTKLLDILGIEHLSAEYIELEKTKELWNDGKTDEEIASLLEMSVKKAKELVKKLDTIYEPIKAPNYKTGKMSMKYI